jgi:hypothetical protein
VPHYYEEDMSLPKDKRFIFVCEMRIRQTPLNAPDIDIEEIYKGLSSLGNKFPVTKTEQDQIHYFIKEFSLTKDYAIFLFHMRNATIADQVQQDVGSGDLKAFPKSGGNYVPILSAHLVIARKPTKTGSNSYDAYIENVEGISKTVMLVYLRDLFKRYFEQDYTRSVRGKQETKTYHPYPELLGHQSNTLESALKGGAVLDELIFERKDQEKTAFDAPRVRETDYTVKIKMDPHLTGDEALSTLEKIRAKMSTEYKKAKVKITPRSGRSKLTPIDVKNADLASQLFIYQEEVLGFTKPLAPCEDSIRTDLVNKMIACTT